MPIGRLHVLTDFFFQQRFSHAELAQLAISGGADMVQFRQKTGALRHKLHEARRVVDVCAEADVPLVIDDHLDVSLAVDAAGVHLGQEDFPIREARRLLGPEALVGATATTVAQALQAQGDGADYIGFGPVFPTGSKANPASTKGLDGLTAVCEAVALPVIAIAGITPPRVPLVLEAGAHGVAVLSAIALAEQPDRATALFRQAIEDFLS
ncbi:MAG: thiamine phosphate synthase [Rhodothermales bacterium]